MFFSIWYYLFSFKDKVVWITGASSGIGEALVYAFAKEGARVVLSSRREEELIRVKKQTKLSDDSVLILPLDLLNNSSFSDLVQKVIDKFGRIDILVNNGGISQRSWVKDTGMDIDRKIMEINYFGTIALTKAVLPRMIMQKAGNIVVISSISGKFGFYLRSAYSASKHALHGFFDSLRMEHHKDNIQVLLVCPGKINTNISYHALTANGTHGKMDKSQEEGMTAEDCAERIIDGIKKNKEEIYIGDWKGRLALWLKRFLPSFFSKQLRKQKAE